MSTIIEKYIDAFRCGRDVTAVDAELLLDAMISETDEEPLAKLFVLWNEKGIAGDEIFELSRIMRDRCRKISSRHATVVDIVGTGGSRAKTFNVSTAAAFAVAGAGVPVAKHGNRAATSASGSADVLSELGVEPAVEPEIAERCLNEIGMCFMFAPKFHRLSATLAKVRRGLGFPTIFNCVGPLCNPAGVQYQLIGAWDRELVPRMAEALARLGTGRSWILHGSDGLDEISLSGTTFVTDVDRGAVSTFELEPEEFGIERREMDGIRVSSAEESAKLIKSVLAGAKSATAAESIVILNAAAAIYIAGHSEDLVIAAGVATESIKTGNAQRKLEALMSAGRE